MKRLLSFILDCSFGVSVSLLELKDTIHGDKFSSQTPPQENFLVLLVFLICVIRFARSTFLRLVDCYCSVLNW